MSGIFWYGWGCEGTCLMSSGSVIDYPNVIGPSLISLSLVLCCFQQVCFWHAFSLAVLLHLDICLRWNLSAPHNLSFPSSYCATTSSLSNPSSVAHHFPFCNAILMLVNMPKPSMLPAPNHFQYAPSFIGTYQHLFICYLLHPTDFQYPPPGPY